MRNNTFRISIIPLILFVSLTVQPPQGNDKGNKGNNEKSQAKQNDKKEGRGHDENSRSKGREQDMGNNSRGNNGNNNKNEHASKDNKGKGNAGNGHSGNKNEFRDNKGKGDGNHNGKFRKEAIRWDWDNNIQWGFDNYPNRKRPKDHKKVTICHNTGDNNYPVTISVSENAMKAHLNHGDQVGDCGNGYSDRWPGNYIRTRENVYNEYENTWETMSYSEALIRYAAERLLGIKSNFQSQRSSLSSDEVQRKEILIMELQNNINSLENQLRDTRRRTDGVNINIML